MDSLENILHISYVQASLQMHHIRTVRLGIGSCYIFKAQIIPRCSSGDHMLKCGREAAVALTCSQNQPQAQS